MYYNKRFGKKKPPGWKFVSKSLNRITKITHLKVILHFCQSMKRKVSICHICIKSIFKSCLASDPYHQLVFQRALIVWRSKKVT